MLVRFGAFERCQAMGGDFGIFSDLIWSSQSMFVMIGLVSVLMLIFSARFVKFCLDSRFLWSFDQLFA